MTTTRKTRRTGPRVMPNNWKDDGRYGCHPCRNCGVMIPDGFDLCWKAKCKPRRLTNKEKVLRRWPRAMLGYAYTCQGRPGGWLVWAIGKTSAYWHIQGHGRTPALAWKDAASRLT